MSHQTESNVIHLSRPGAGQTVNVPIDAGKIRLSLGFAPNPNAVRKDGQHLEFSFEDGGKIVLEGFYDYFASNTLPVIVTESGDELPGEDFLASLREDLATAAGPAAGAGSGGSGDYADDAGSLIEGISRFGSHGTIYWDRELKVPEEHTGDALVPAISITPILPGLPGTPVGPGNPNDPSCPENPICYLAEDGFNLKVDESHMPGGTNAESVYSAPVYRLEFQVNSNDGFASVTIGGVTYPVVGGTLRGFSSAAGNNGGIFNPAVTPIGNGGYILSFSYRQGHAQQHTAGGKDIHDNADSWLITVTSNNGASVSVAANVDIVDDVPVLTLVDGISGLAAALVDESHDSLGGAYSGGVVSATLSAGAVQGLFAKLCGYDGQGTPDAYSLKLSSRNVATGLYAVKEGGGDDNIFGDAVNADFMLEGNWAGDHQTAGQTWDITGLNAGAFLEIVSSYLVFMHGLNSPAEITRQQYSDFIDEFKVLLGQSDTVEDADGNARGADDILHGGDGDDFIFGQGGNDLIYGDEGSDAMWGGDGADTFDWENITPGYDQDQDKIMDFSMAEGDRLQFSNILGGGDGELHINPELLGDNLLLTLTKTVGGEEIMQTIEIQFRKGGIEYGAQLYDNAAEFVRGFNGTEAEAVQTLMNIMSITGGQ